MQPQNSRQFRGDDVQVSHVAYLCSQYPAASHTFVAREIVALRERGLKVSAFSVRAGESGAVLPDPIANATPAILAQPKWAIVLSLGSGLSRRPRRFFGTLRLALQHRVPGARNLLWAWFHFVEAIVLSALLSRAGATRIHSHFANSGATVGLLAAHFLGLPWSLTLHGISETDYPAGALLGRKIVRAEFVACASWFMAAQAARLVDPAHWPKLTLVRCEIDPAELPASTVTPVGTAIRFIAVGRLSPEKGFSGLLASFAKAAARAPGISLTLVGDGPDRSSLCQQVADLGLADIVKFAGALPSGAVLAEIAAHDVLVLPSLMEGLPLVLIEALALQRPVIASRVAGIPELVVEGTNGWLFNPFDWNDLTMCLLAAAGNHAFLTALGAQAKSSITAEFLSGKSWDVLRERFDGAVTPIANFGQK